MPRLCILALTLALGGTVTAADDLREAVRQPDESYRYEVVREARVGSCEATILSLTSQTWRGIEWRHWLSILVPEEVEHPDKAILFVTGGSSGSDPPDGGSVEALMLSTLASQSNAVLAVLQQVPNQPLFGGLREDDLIAFTFEKYLDGEGDDWPLLVPMVRSAVRAMDAVQQVTADELGMSVEGFIVSGASKRGWTTWLTAVADPRVVAIAPMVIDVLNIGPQMEQQARSYGGFSEQVRAYTEREIQARMRSQEGRRLVSLVDPFEYREVLSLPKLMVLGTNDPYWTVDASSLYFPELSGPKSLYYLPNAGHGLGLGILPTMTAFFRASLGGETLPALTWATPEDGGFRVEWEDTSGTARLWQARSSDRDFRESEWTASPLDGEGRCEVSIEEPREGWAAWFVEVSFRNGDGKPFRLSTEIQVLPDRFPHEPAGTGDAAGGE